MKYRYYVLGVLTLVYTVSFVDRQLLSILQESIKLELGLSDKQLGLLTGFSFAVFYIGAGIPIARWADVANRRNIVAGAVAVWSLMTAVTGFAVNYLQLMLARIGVGIGEAGCSPPAHSMISDLFEEEKRATAMSIYVMGAFLGIMVGFYLGGILDDALGWRKAFIVVGLPGVLVSLLLMWTVREPLRVREPHRSDEEPSIKEVLRFLWHARSLRWLILAGGLGAMVTLGGTTWVAPFFMRVHNVPAAELGVWLALGAGAAGAAGSLAGGLLFDWLAHFDVRWRLWGPGLSKFLIVVTSLTIYFTPNSSVALSVFAVQGALAAMYLGSTLAILHTVMGTAGRALASAVYLFSINIIGLGLGPFLIGAISDLLISAQVENSLRYALAFTVPVFAAMSGVLLMLAARNLPQDLSGKSY